MAVKPMRPHEIAAATGDYGAVSADARRRAIHLNADDMDAEPDATWGDVVLGIGLWLCSIVAIAYCGLIR